MFGCWLLQPHRFGKALYFRHCAKNREMQQYQTTTIVYVNTKLVMEPASLMSPRHGLFFPQAQAWTFHHYTNNWTTQTLRKRWRNGHDIKARYCAVSTWLKLQHKIFKFCPTKQLRCEVNFHFKTTRSYAMEMKNPVVLYGYQCHKFFTLCPKWIYWVVQWVLYNLPAYVAAAALC